MCFECCGIRSVLILVIIEIAFTLTGITALITTRGIIVLLPCIGGGSTIVTAVTDKIAVGIRLAGITALKASSATKSPLCQEPSRAEGRTPRISRSPTRTPT